MIRPRCIALLCAAVLLASCSSSNMNSRAEIFAALPDWSGVWIIDGPAGEVPISGYPEGQAMVTWQLLGATAPLKGEVAELWAKLSKATSFEEAAQVAPEFMSRVAQSKSQGWGMPDMMESPAPMQFLITPEETTLVNYYRDVRHIYTDGRPDPAPEDVWPTPWGYSSGRWEGDTLVVETSGVQPGYGPLVSLVFTAASSFSERLRKTGPDRIESEMTITDPETINGKWTIKLAYRRASGMDRMFHNAFDNDRTGVEGGMLTIEAPKQKL